ncbi:MAG: hypothetical protein CMM01_19980 [Rhodopirellula sp.]|nr:hypothetical protein [Rhodopirellula sp.]
MPTLHRHNQQSISTLMTAQQLSEVFGVHTNTIWRWVDQDRFPKPVRVSRKIVRFRAEDVQEFLRTRAA